MSAKQTPSHLYAEQYITRFDSPDAALAHFEALQARGRWRYRFPLPRWVAKLFLLACMVFALFLLLDYDYGKVQASIFDRRGNDFTVSLVLDEATRPLFKPEAIRTHQHCLRPPSRVCLMLLQDIRTKPEIMVSPETRVNDTCRALAKRSTYFGLSLEYAFDKTKNGAGTEATRCVLTNEAAVHRRDFFEIWRLAAALALNLIGLIGLILI